jgi:carbon monoxide dehydrogenase subunit G
VPVIEESIVISRPTVEVFEFLTEPENVLLYSSNVVEYEQVSGAPREVGGVARGTVRVAGRRLSFTTELVEVEPARLARSQSSDASIPFRLELRFDEVPEGTRVTWHQETDELGGFFGKLGDAVVVKVYARDVRSNLANAKTLLEAQ